MPDETPLFLITLAGAMVVMIVFVALVVVGNNDPKPPIRPAVEGTIAPAEEC